MSETSTTEPTTAPDPLTAEERQRATEWDAQRARSEKAELHRRFGYSDQDVVRAVEKSVYASQRLGLDEAAVIEAERLLGPVGAVEVASRWGDGLSSLPPDMTPAQAAEEVADLMGDRAFFEALERGDLKARRRWDGLTSLAARRPR